MSEYTIGDKLFSNIDLEDIKTTENRSRRIEAALQATKSIPTEALEAGVIQDLLEAAKALVDDVDYCCENVLAKELKQLRAAVAKAESNE